MDKKDWREKLTIQREPQANIISELEKKKRLRQTEREKEETRGQIQEGEKSSAEVSDVGVHPRTRAWNTKT